MPWGIIVNGFRRIANKIEEQMNMEKGMKESKKMKEEEEDYEEEEEERTP